MNLAAFVHTLMASAPDQAEQLRDRLREAVPEIEWIAAPFQGRAPSKVELRARMAGGKTALRWDSLAAGHRKALAIVAALAGDPPATLLALEEPDAGIHPGLLQWLVEFLRHLSTERMVLITTHQPWLADQLRLDEVRVLSASGGSTRAVAPRAEPEKREQIEQELGTLAMTGALG